MKILIMLISSFCFLNFAVAEEKVHNPKPCHPNPPYNPRPCHPRPHNPYNPINPYYPKPYNPYPYSYPQYHQNQLFWQGYWDGYYHRPACNWSFEYQQGHKIGCYDCGCHNPYYYNQFYFQIR